MYLFGPIPLILDAEREGKSYQDQLDVTDPETVHEVSDFTESEQSTSDEINSNELGELVSPLSEEPVDLKLVDDEDEFVVLSPEDAPIEFVEEYPIKVLFPNRRI
jgi:hypothetical protein